ncbi:MAG: hypothetical protein QME12_06550 [Nanoarchaeota archaeon]|nr:hypothetical protein [Nanoarchaeota archaeon]
MNSVKEYKEYRKAGIKLNHEIINSCIDKEIMEKSAKMLGITGKNNILVFENEDEMNVMMDFALYEYMLEGENIVKIYRGIVGGKNEIEKDILNAMVSSYTSLFRVISTSGEDSLVKLDDLLNKGRVVELTDLNLSKSLISDVLIFTRIVPFGSFNMTAGIAFLFNMEAEEALSRYNQARITADDSAEKYVFFFKLNRECGIETEFR